MTRKTRTILFALATLLVVAGAFLLFPRNIMAPTEVPVAITETATEMPTEIPTEIPIETPVAKATVTAAALDTAATDAIPTATPEEAEQQGNVASYKAEVVNRYPHDPAAFTQGLVWEGGVFLEGTGLRGRSTLRRVDAESGEVQQSVALAEQYFGEGITTFGDKLYQLTWQSQTGFVYDRQSFELLQEFSYPTEGWGITHDGERLIMSDGSATLFFWDPETLDQVDSVNVTLGGEPVRRLNELEYIDGSVYANVWQTDQIVIIDPATGVVTGVIDLTNLLTADLRSGTEDVLNGIAYDEAANRLFVTGKLWPWIFEIRLVEAGD